VKEIPLSRGKVAIVDEDDYEWLLKYNWHYTTKGYAVRKTSIVGEKTQVFMHREIINCPDDKQVDHINRNKLDNRKENLRIATNAQNAANRDLLDTNTSGFRGVSFSKRVGKWQAYSRENGRHKHLGYYFEKEDAAKAYNVLNDVDHSNFNLRLKPKTSKYKGVSFNNARKQWYVNIHLNGSTVFLGSFDCEHDAARMYNFWALDIYGEATKLNVINEEEAK
jgi:hypothetical protein